MFGVIAQIYPEYLSGDPYPRVDTTPRTFSTSPPHHHHFARIDDGIQRPPRTDVPPATHDSRCPHPPRVALPVLASSSPSPTASTRRRRDRDGDETGMTTTMRAMGWQDESAAFACKRRHKRSACACACAFAHEGDDDDNGMVTETGTGTGTRPGRGDSGKTTEVAWDMARRERTLPSHANADANTPCVCVGVCTRGPGRGWTTRGDDECSRAQYGLWSGYGTAAFVSWVDPGKDLQRWLSTDRLAFRLLSVTGLADEHTICQIAEYI